MVGHVAWSKGEFHGASEESIETHTPDRTRLLRGHVRTSFWIGCVEALEEARGQANRRTEVVSIEGRESIEDPLAN